MRSLILLLVMVVAITAVPGCGSVPAAGTLNSTVLDSDGDGFSDDTEINGIPGTNPFDATDNPGNVRDTDGDGCSDYDELNFSGFCDNDPDSPGSAFDLITPELRSACRGYGDSVIAALIVAGESSVEVGFTKEETLSGSLDTCSDSCGGDGACALTCVTCLYEVIDLVWP